MGCLHSLYSLVHHKLFHRLRYFWYFAQGWETKNLQIQLSCTLITLQLRQAELQYAHVFTQGHSCKTSPISLNFLKVYARCILPYSEYYSLCFPIKIDFSFLKMQFLEYKTSSGATSLVCPNTIHHKYFVLRCFIDAEEDQDLHW